MRGHPRNFVFLATTTRSVDEYIHRPNQKRTFARKNPADQDTVVHSLPEYPAYEAIPIQAVRCRSVFSRRWRNVIPQKDLPSVAYEHGLGYNSFFLFAS